MPTCPTLTARRGRWRKCLVPCIYLQISGSGGTCRLFIQSYGITVS